MRRRIFEDLVRHFFGRFFDKESLSPQGAPEAGVIQTLGFLIPPSGFVCLLMMVFGPRGWDLAGLRLLFVTYSMVAMGVVMVFEWDALFLDRRDYLILTPLPLRTIDLFFSKLAALAIFLGIFLTAINGLSVLLWPAIESKAPALAATGAHLVVTASAGLFSALAIAALHGLLATVLRGAAYRRVSVIAQAVILATLILFLFLSPLLGSQLPQLCRTNTALLRWLPQYWFLGWYEQLRPAAADLRGGTTLAGLGPTGIRSLWIALALFTATLLPGYRRHARRALELAEPSPKGPGPVRRTLSALAQRLLADAVEYGVFEFISHSLARSLKHRLFLAVYGGFGAAMVIVMRATGGSTTRIPLMLSFVLISGLRAAFNFPSDLRANWAFQVSETSSLSAYVRATRKWMFVYAILPLFLVTAGIEAITQPWTAVAFHFAFGVAMSLVLMEALFLNFHKVPFTCSHLPGKVNLVFLVALYALGFTFYSSWMAAVEERLWAAPLAAAMFFLAIGAIVAALSRARETLLRIETGLEYEDDGNPSVRTLGLTQP